MSCDGCRKNDQPAEDKKGGGASQAAVEFMGEKFTTIIKWLCALLLVSMLGHIAWIVAWTQYDYSSEETVVEAEDGVANYIGGMGDIINGPDNRP